MQERERLIVQYLPLVRSVARRFARADAELDDLVQVGAIGLIKAIDRFDPSRGVDLAAYARPTVTGEIQRHLRDVVPAVRPPRRLHDLSRRVRRLRRERGGQVTIEELARAVGTSTAEVGEADALAASPSTVSLELVAPPEDDPYDASDDRLLVASFLQVLPKRERRILELRYYDGLSQREIALALGLSQIHVSRLIARSLETLREETEKPLSPIVLPASKSYTRSYGAGGPARRREVELQRPAAAAHAARAAR